MDISNLEDYYKKSFNSKLKDLIHREIVKDAWFSNYIRFISYYDDIGFMYNGDTFDNISQVKSKIRRENY